MWSYYGVRYYGFSMQVSILYARWSVACVPSSTDDREGPAYIAQENTFPEPDRKWVSALFTDESSFTMETSGAFRALCWSRRNNAQISSIHHTDTKLVQSWFEKESHSVVTLTCMCQMEEIWLAWDFGMRSLIHMFTRMPVLLATTSHSEGW